MKQVIGVDIGGVIIDRANDNTDTSFFSGNYLKTTATKGVFEALRDLVEKKFGENVYIVSKCGKNIQGKTLEWLNHHNFYTITGIRPEAVHFCLERHQKAGICEKLGITHFIDDRLEILGSLSTVNTLYLFQPREEEILKNLRHLHRVKKVNSWEEVLQRELGNPKV